MGSKTESASAAVASPGKQRIILVLLDSSKSYKDYEAAIQGLLSALNNLGPRDRIVIARTAEHFDPKDFILLDASTRKLSDEILSASRNIQEWGKKQHELEAAWQRVTENVVTISQVLIRLKGANTMLKTDLHGAVEYSVGWLNSQPGEEKILIVCSDLEHDTGRPTFAPPANLPDVKSLRVNLHFISHKNSQHWKQIEGQWGKYFSGAAGFEMLDSGRSSSALIISASAVPRQVPNPLKRGSEN
jgi:hypothetical protein